MRVKLQRLREKAGHTQQTLADFIGISRSHYSQIETGEKTPSLSVGIKIKKALNYSGDDIWADDNFFNKKSPDSRQK